MYYFFDSSPVYRPLILEIDTTKPGSASDTLEIPLTFGATVQGYGYSGVTFIQWGDGSVSRTNGSETLVSHTYPVPGTYRVKLYGIRNEPHQRVQYNNSSDKLKVIRVLSWGSGLKLFHPSAMFYGCENLISLPADIMRPTAIPIARMTNMFRGCTNLNAATTAFDTSQVSDMRFLFQDCTSLKQSFAHFRIPSLTSATSMFSGCDINETGTTTNYDATLNSWASQAFLPNVPFHAGTSKYSSAASAARATLVAAGWTITDGGLA